MDSADTLPEAAWSVLDILATVPAWVWAVGGIGAAFGIIVLVFLFSDVSYSEEATYYLS